MANERSVSEILYQLLMHLEGWRDHVYHDPIGLPTVGFGHLVKEGEVFPARITKADGRELLVKDVAETEEWIAKEFPNLEFTQHEYDALVSFLFNVRKDSFKKSQSYHELKRGNKLPFENNIKRWVHGRVKDSNGVNRLVRLPGLIIRRDLEYRLWKGELTWGEVAYV